MKCIVCNYLSKGNHNVILYPKNFIVIVCNYLSKGNLLSLLI